MSDVTPAAPPLWRAAGASVIGAAHARAGKPKQDALGWRPAQGRSVALAVADGHGSPKCFRSERGAQFAVDVALALLSPLLEAAGDAGAVGEMRRHVKEVLPREIVAQWRQLVEADLAREPITEEEWATLAARDGEAAQLPVRAEPALAYGSTLLAAAATPRFLLVLQNGDGDILSVSQEGIVARPLPGDSRLIANETTSLCSADAVENFRSAFHELTATPPALIILSTDGYANSFQDEAGFLQVGGDLLSMISTHGLGQVTANLEDWLGHASKEGSGDDVTLGLLALQWEGGGPPPAPVRPATPNKALASVGSVEAASIRPSTEPERPSAPIMPEQVIRPPTTAVALPQSMSAARSTAAAHSLPMPQSVPMPQPPTPQSTPYANAPSTATTSPARSILGALGVLLLALVLLTVATVIRKGHHVPPDMPGKPGVRTPTGVPDMISLGTVQAGTTVVLSQLPAQPRSGHYRLLAPHPGLSLVSREEHPALVINRDQTPGPLRAEISFLADHGRRSTIQITGEVTAVGANGPKVSPREFAPTSPPGAPSDPSSTPPPHTPAGHQPPDGKSVGLS